MKMKFLRELFALGVLAVTIGAVAPALAANSPASGEKKQAAKDLVLKGDAKCTECHDESDSPKALSIGKTKHGVTADSRTPSCTDCHGASELHVKEAGRGGKKSPPVDVLFSGKGTSSAQARSQACLTCHEKSAKRHFWSGSAHETNDVACTSCHNVHAAKDNVRDKLSQADVCYTCHKDKRAEGNRPSRHPTKEGKVVCSDCHNPHGTAGSKLLARGTVNETCYQCHMEKRGPFLHNHQPVNEDCSICHNPHGTTIGSMLKSRPPFLCQECHNEVSTGHPGQLGVVPAAPTTGTSSLGTVARGCLNCHTSIHGDNNPQGTTATRRFFR